MLQIDGWSSHFIPSLTRAIFFFTHTYLQHLQCFIFSFFPSYQSNFYMFVFPRCGIKRESWNLLMAKKVIERKLIFIIYVLYSIRWIEADTRSLILCIAIIAIHIMIASVVSWFMQYQRILWFYHRMETFSPRQFTLRDAGHVSGDCNSSHLGNQSMIFLLFIPHLLLPIVGMLLYAKHPAQLSDCWPLTSGRVPAGILFFFCFYSERLS